MPKKASSVRVRELTSALEIPLRRGFTRGSSEAAGIEESPPKIQKKISCLATCRTSVQSACDFYFFIFKLSSRFV